MTAYVYIESTSNNSHKRKHKRAEHSISGESVQARAAGKQTLPCGGRKKAWSRSGVGPCTKVVCFLLMLTRIRTVHTHNSIKMKKKEIDTQDCRLGSPFALFHIVNLRCRVATSHVWMCTVYVLICLGSRRGGAECVWVLRYQSCWTYLAPHRVSEQTRGSRVGWAGCTLFFPPFPPWTALLAPFSHR